MTKSPIFSIIATTLAIRIWHGINPKDISQKVWAGIAAAISYDALKKYNGVDMVAQVLAEGVGGASLTSEERAYEGSRRAAGLDRSTKNLIERFNLAK
jgi:hypothetical protein